MSWSQAVERTVTGLGYELVDIERVVGGLLRVSIDRIPGHAYPTGEHEFVTVEDCEAVTRQLQHVLEVDNVDYARFVGQQVQITLKLPFQGRKKYEGLLANAEEGDGWQIIFHDGKVDQVLDFAFEEVREARLVPVLDFKGRRGKTGQAADAAESDKTTDGGQEQ